MQQWNDMQQLKLVLNLKKNDGKGDTMNHWCLPTFVHLICPSMYHLKFYKKDVEFHGLLKFQFSSANDEVRSIQLHINANIPSYITFYFPSTKENKNGCNFLSNVLKTAWTDNK